MTDLVITGLGLVTSLGHGVESTRLALRRGLRGFAGPSWIDTSSCDVGDAGESTALAGEDPSSPDERGRVRRRLDAVCTEALRQAGFPGARFPRPRRAALVAGSSLACSSSSPGFWRAYIEAEADADPAALGSYDVEPLLAGLCERFGVEGESFLVSSACAAGASAIARAAGLVRLGRADAALAVGFDGLALHTFAGFASLAALAPGDVLPFSDERAGMKIGDGFAALVIERTAEVGRGGRTPLARLLGWGESSDAHHLTRPHPDGRGAALAMRRALADAGLSAGDVDHINAHATATPANDAAEYAALREVFGERLGAIPISTTKASIGHTLGAAGAVEAAVTVLALVDSFIPPNPGAARLSSQFDIDLPAEGRRCPLRVAMSNSFGFGGCNASLLIGRWDG